MALFSTLFGDSGSDAARQAGAQRAEGYEQGEKQLRKMPDIYKRGLRQSIGHLDTAEGRALGLYDQGTGQAQGYLSDALTPFEEIYGQDQVGRNMYMDSLGLGGAEGRDRALGAFQTGPGYEFDVAQQLEGINRRRNSAGMLTSGNADIDAMNYMHGRANQEYGGWQDRLAGFDPMKSAQARAGVLTQLAGLFQGAGAAKAGLVAGMGENRANLTTGATNNIAGVKPLLAGHAIGAANSEAQATTDAYQANASQDATLLNALLSAGGMGAYLYGRSGSGA